MKMSLNGTAEPETSWLTPAVDGDLVRNNCSVSRQDCRMGKVSPPFPPEIATSQTFPPATLQC